jgi:hypothetical protein
MKKTFEIPEKWAFNHDTNTLYETVGMEESRIDEIINSMRHAAIESKTQGQLLENTLNFSKPQNLTDVIIAAFCAGVCHGQNRHQNPLKRLFQSLQNDD